MKEDKKVNEAAKKLSQLGASKGGKARADVLTAQERSEIARNAAEKRWGKSGKKIPRALYMGELTLVQLKIPCAVLEDEIRVISERSIANALGTKGSGSYWQKKRNEKGALLPEYLSAKNLEPFVSDETKEKLTNPITYISKSGVKSRGVPGTVLQEICEIWLKARDKGALTKTQILTAKKAEILMRAFAQVGIIALIDEATGYQSIRDKQALEQILRIYIAKELRPWLKTFPDEFYKHLFRLRGWIYNPQSIARPGVVGAITNDLIYKRLAPGILGELKKKTPRTKKGHTKHRYFQLLTEEIGHPKLREHLAKVTVLMEISPDWDSFNKLLDKALPKYGNSLPLPFKDADIEQLAKA